MGRVAGCRLLRLSKNKVCVPDEYLLECAALADNSLQLIETDHRTRARHLDDGSARRDRLFPSPQRGQAIDNPIPPDHGGFDHLAGGQAYDQGNYGRVRKIDAINNVTNPTKDSLTD